jgi:pyruvate, water dikinase
MVYSGRNASSAEDQRPGNRNWIWRNEMAVAMAEALDMDRFGVKALYLIGSTKTGEAGPCSDIDLLAHCTDEPEKHQALQAFFEGWGICLSLLNKQKTGYETRGSLVDLHIISDADIENKDSFAAMIGSVNNSAKLLRQKASYG